MSRRYENDFLRYENTNDSISPRPQTLVLFADKFQFLLCPYSDEQITNNLTPGSPLALALHQSCLLQSMTFLHHRLIA